MNLLVYPNDIVKELLTSEGLEEAEVKHIRHGLAYPQACDTVLLIDEENDRFKVMKCSAAVEFTNVWVDGLENMRNFV